MPITALGLSLKMSGKLRFARVTGTKSIQLCPLN
jgi:hypothetical protein